MGEQFNIHSQKHKHEHHERLCYHCNELQSSSEEIHKFEIRDRGYQSEFVDDVFAIQLCKACVDELEIEEAWFDNEICFDTVIGSYRYESYILNLVDSFPIYNQEYIYNCYNVALCGFPNDKRVSREDWIMDNM